LPTHDALAIAHRAYRKHKALHPLAPYTGILSLHAMARLALCAQDERLLEECRADLRPFARGECDWALSHANFTNYTCGGYATAFLYWQGAFPEAEHAVRHYAEDTVRRAPRDPQGLFCHPGDPGRDKIWIDIAYAVSPFLLFAGLALGEERYVAEAFRQTEGLYAILRDPENGLLHQCRGFVAPGVLSEDHWSRGNGWCLLALAEFVQYLPETDPRRPEAERLFGDLLGACLGYQDAEGLWHQELTDPTSYVETSGTGLILYATGVGLARGLAIAGAEEAFQRGLRGYLGYIGEDGSVFHTCRGCLCPGRGTVLDYKARAPVRNDPHAFGPVILAYGQALRLGLRSLEAP
jgi:unsaturated rhamnogalacturonyl hydrolase